MVSGKWLLPPYNDITFFKKRQQPVYRFVYGGAGFNHHEDLARLCEICDKLLERIGGDEIAVSVLRREFVDPLKLAVEDGDGEALRFDVAGEIFAHYGKTDHANISKFFHLFYLCLFMSGAQPCKHQRRKNHKRGGGNEAGGAESREQLL